MSPGKKKQRGRDGPGGEKRTEQKESKVSRCGYHSSRLQDYIHGAYVMSVVTADPDYSQINVAKAKRCLPDLLSLFVRLQRQPQVVMRFLYHSVTATAHAPGT